MLHRIDNYLLIIKIKNRRTTHCRQSPPKANAQTQRRAATAAVLTVSANQIKQEKNQRKYSNHCKSFHKKK